MIAYWTVTLLLAISITLRGIGQLMRFLLESWKLLGVIAIVVPAIPRLTRAALHIASWALRPKSRRL